MAMLKSNSAAITAIQEGCLKREVSRQIYNSIDNDYRLRKGEREWRVVDSNYLRDIKLSDYLGNTRRGLAIPDDVVTEMIKRDSIRTAFESLKGLRGSYEQVVVLKGNEDLIKYPYPTDDIVYLVDYEQTNIFHWLIHSHVEKCETCRTNLIKTGGHRAKNLSDIENDAAGWLRSFSSVADGFSKAELKELVGDNRVSADLARKIGGTSWNYCLDFYNEESRLHWFSAEECTKTIFYRMVLTLLLQALDWAATGRNFNIKNRKVLNDIVDSRIAAVSLFFAGLLSNDRKLIRLHLRARRVLELIGRKGLPRHCEKCDPEIPPRYQHMYNQLSRRVPFLTRKFKLSVVQAARDLDLTQAGTSKMGLREVETASIIGRNT